MFLFILFYVVNGLMGDERKREREKDRVGAGATEPALNNIVFVWYSNSFLCISRDFILVYVNMYAWHFDWHRSFLIFFNFSFLLYFSVCLGDVCWLYYKCSYTTIVIKNNNVMDKFKHTHTHIYSVLRKGNRNYSLR